MGKFASRGAHVVIDMRRKSEVARADRLVDAKDEARHVSPVRLKWKGPETVDGTTTYYSDGDYAIRLEPR